MIPLADAQSSRVIHMLETYRPIASETHPSSLVWWNFIAKGHPKAFPDIRYHHSTFDAINSQTMETFLRASIAQGVVPFQVYGQNGRGLMILKVHTLNSLKTSDTGDIGIGLEDMTSARITGSVGNVLPENTDSHIQLLSKGRTLTYYKEDARFQENVYGG